MNFFNPYLSMLFGAAFNMLQGFDGLGLSSINFIQHDAHGRIIGGYWSATEAAMLFLGILMILALYIVATTILSGYVISRKKGAFIAISFLALPGMLSIVSLWPEFSTVPNTYYASHAGVYGSASGTITLVLMGLLLGWSLAIISVDVFRLKEKFWHLYDHVWTALGLLAAVFFVMDAQVTEHVGDLQEHMRISQQSSSFLQKQAAAYEQACKQEERTTMLSCRWASNVQQKLLDYSTSGSILFVEFGPKSTADVYSISGVNLSAQEILTIRREIANYNRTTCPIEDLGGGFRQTAPTSVLCQVTPPEFCTTYPDPLDGKVNTDNIIVSQAFASECIIPTLVNLRARVAPLVNQVDLDKKAKNYRWLYYLIFSCLVGGKIAGSTVKFSDIDKRHETKRRSVHFFRRLLMMFLTVVKIIFRLMFLLTRVLFKCMKSIFLIGKRCTALRH